MGHASAHVNAMQIIYDGYDGLTLIAVVYSPPWATYSPTYDTPRRRLASSYTIHDTPTAGPTLRILGSRPL